MSTSRFVLLAALPLVAISPMIHRYEVSAFVPPPPRVAPLRTLQPLSTRRLSPLRRRTGEQKDHPAAVPSSPRQISSSSILMKIASSPVGALAILAFIVLFHESGHYLAARSFGIHPDEFSIGFGPKLVGFGAFGDEFNLRAFLLGGYVKIPAYLLQSLPRWEQFVVSSAGVASNLLLALSLGYGQAKFGPGIPRPVFDRGVAVGALSSPSSPDQPAAAAASGILRQNDVLLAVQGKALVTSTSPSEAEAQKAISYVIDTVRNLPEGEALQLSVLRSGSRPNGKPVDVNITPKRAMMQDGKLGPPTMGVFLQPNLVRVDVAKSDTVLEAMGTALEYVAALTKDTAAGLLTFAGDVVRGKAGSSEYRISGPLGVVDTASKVVATQDWNIVVLYAVAVNVNLAVVNAVPIPPSDGFQIAFILGETLFRHLKS